MIGFIVGWFFLTTCADSDQVGMVPFPQRVLGTPKRPDTRRMGLGSVGLSGILGPTSYPSPTESVAMAVAGEKRNVLRRLTD